MQAFTKSSQGLYAQALSWLLTMPGASKTVLESRIPYGGGQSMAEVLGKEPVKFASTQTAVDMARSAYKQAAHLSPFGASILGVSCTCALAIGRLKKGDHKASCAACARVIYKDSKSAEWIHHYCFQRALNGSIC